MEILTTFSLFAFLTILAGKRRCSESFPKGYFSRLHSLENGDTTSKGKYQHYQSRRQSISSSELKIDTVKDSYIKTVFNRIKDFVTDTRVNINLGQICSIHRSDSLYSRMEEGILEHEGETTLYPVTDKCVIVSECTESTYMKAFDPIWRLLSRVRRALSHLVESKD